MYVFSATDDQLIKELESRGAFNPVHVYEVGAMAIAVQHPMRCRMNGKSLLDCEESKAALSLPSPPVPPGRYTATFSDGEFSDWMREK